MVQIFRSVMNNNSSTISRVLPQLLFLATVVIVVFYPTIHAEVSLIDDVDMLNWLQLQEPVGNKLHQILIPGAADGGYYRPLTGISFLIDKMLFGADPVIMHLEAVLFHLLNVFLVFFLTRECLALLQRHQDSFLPFIAALLFGVHPITTESVNWISGRTDIMMGNCVLLGAFLLIRYKRIGNFGYLLAAIFAVFAGVLVKEAAFGALAGGVLVYSSIVADDCGREVGIVSRKWSSSPVIDFMIFYGIAFLFALLTGGYWIVLLCFAGYWLLSMFRQNRTDIASLRKYIRYVLIVLAAASVSAALFFLLRRVAFTSDAGKIGNTIRLMCMDPNYSISLFIGAFGFYIQKFIFPWPLNFFILEINPLYDFAGIAVVLIMVRLLTIHTISSALFFVGAGLIVPVLPFVFGTIAWTSYAERYIYLPAAFWIVALVLQYAKLSGGGFRINHPVVKLLLMLLIPAGTIVFSVATWQRNIVWQQNVTLLRDTVDKSPKAKALRDFYMAALFYVGRYDEAAEQYEAGKMLYSRTYDPVPDIMMAMMLQRMKKNNEAYLLYQKANIKTGYKSEPTLNAMIRFLEVALGDPSFSIPRQEIKQQIQSYRLMISKTAVKPVPGQIQRQTGGHI